MTQPGYQITPGQLDAFATTMDDGAAQVRAAADRIGTANSFNFNAFGFALGQVFAAPARIALRVVQDKVAGAGESLAADVQPLRDTASSYRGMDDGHAGTYTGAGG